MIVIPRAKSLAVLPRWSSSAAVDQPETAAKMHPGEGPPKSFREPTSGFRVRVFIGLGFKG